MAATLLALLAVCGLLAGCAGDDHTSPASLDPLTTKMGDTVSLTSDQVGKSLKLLVTYANGARVPAVTSPAAGRHPALFGVHLVIENRGRAVYRGSVYRSTYLWDSTYGVRLKPLLSAGNAHGRPLPRATVVVKLGPGAKVSRWVWFAAARRPDFDVLVYKATPWAFVGEWSLSGRPVPQ